MARGAEQTVMRSIAGADDPVRARLHALRTGLEAGLIGASGLVERLLIGLLTAATS